MIHAKNQRLCIWSGIVGINVFFVGFVIAHFMPIPSPSLTQEVVVATFQQNATAIRIGMIFMLASCMFFPPFVAVVSVHLKRIEGSTPITTYTQLSAATVGVLFIAIPAVCFLVTAYRPDRPPELTYLMYDFSWIMTVVVWPPAFIQNVSIGVAILSDRSTQPVFPRWVGFFQFWIALLFVPASLLAFFKSGAFAWSGIFGFYIPGVAFGSWYIVMSIMMFKAIRKQEQELI